MAKNKACARLAREIRGLQTELPAGVLDMHINEANIHDMHFLLAGPPDSPYEGGQYVLNLQLPKDYPMRAPDFIVKTPSGRFAVDHKVCTSFSSFHPETWTPSYRIETLLISFISFIVDTGNAAGVIMTSDGEKRGHALASLAFNKKRFGKLLPAVLLGASAGATAPAAAAQPAAAPAVPATLEALRPSIKPKPGPARPRAAPTDLAGAPAAKRRRGAAAAAQVHAVVDLADAAPAARRAAPAAAGAAAFQVDLSTHAPPPARGVAPTTTPAAIAPAPISLVDLT